MPMRTLFFIVVLLFSGLANAQITITNSDMPLVNDTLRVSNTGNVGTSDPTLTDTNYTWDYTHLTYLNQKIDTFVSVNTTPFLYQLYFNNSIIYPNTKSDLAVHVATPTLTTGLTLSDVYNYYKKPSTQYTQTGFGAKINGVPTSVRFDSLDVIYRFPMNYGNEDSCISKYALNVPSLLYYGQRKKRVNEVDGWGTLKTPFGTFQTLRIKTTLYTTDTIYLSALSFGTTINRPTEVQYKWLGANSRIPLLQINTIGSAVTSVVYRDSARANLFPSGLAEKNSNANFVVYPSPVSSEINIDHTLDKTGDVMIELYDIIGNKITTLYSGQQQQGNFHFNANIEKLSLSNGMYILKIVTNGERVYSEKIVIEK